MLRALRERFFAPPAPIDPARWEAAERALPLLRQLAPAERERLRDLCAKLLHGKSFVGVAGLTLTDEMCLHIAAQACLPVLHLGLGWYEGWSGVVVYPAQFRVRRSRHDADGTVHETVEDLSGEAWDGGPVVLSWSDAQAGASGEAGSGNVVIHEFAHKLDLLDGDADGVPPFDRRLHPHLSRDPWLDTLEDALERLRAGLDLAEERIPSHIDPESEEADPWYAALPLDPYAATDEAEFFAVSSEAFFLDAVRLRDAFPRWYELLTAFYRPTSGNAP